MRTDHSGTNQISRGGVLLYRESPKKKDGSAKTQDEARDEGSRSERPGPGEGCAENEKLHARHPMP